MAIPKQIVVYNHYGHSVYFDGKLVAHYSCGSHSTASWFHICKLLGIPFEERSVRWEDMPGQDTDNSACHHPPESLAVMERHFAGLAERRRLERIEQLKRELKTLQAEGKS